MPGLSLVVSAWSPPPAAGPAAAVGGNTKVSHQYTVLQETTGLLTQLLHGCTVCFDPSVEGNSKHCYRITNKCKIIPVKKQEKTCQILRKISSQWVSGNKINDTQMMDSKEGEMENPQEILPRAALPTVNAIEKQALGSIHQLPTAHTKIHPTCFSSAFSLEHHEVNCRLNVTKYHWSPSFQITDF